MKTWRE